MKHQPVLCLEGDEISAGEQITTPSNSYVDFAGSIHGHKRGYKIMERIKS